MNVFITGGAGFLGAHVVARLVEHHHHVLVYDNLSVRAAPASFSHKVTLVQADMLDNAALRQAISLFQPNLVIHLAALHFIPACNKHPDLTMQANLQGTLQLMLAVEDCSSVRSIVFASSGAVYGADSRYHTETEEAEPTDIYGLSKLLAERVIEHYAQSSGINSLILRLANLYGPGETNPHLIPEIVGQIRDGAEILRIGRTDTWRDFLFVIDAANALVEAAEWSVSQPINEIFNFGTGTETCVADILHLLGGICGSNLAVESDVSRIRTKERIHLRLSGDKWNAVFGPIAKTNLRDGLTQTLLSQPGRAYSTVNA